MVSVCSTAASARPVAIQSPRVSPGSRRRPAAARRARSACPCARRRCRDRTCATALPRPGRPVGKAEAGAGETVAGRRRQRMHPGGELLAERRVGELDVVGVDHKLGDGVAHGGVLEQAELDAERASRLAHQRLHAGRNGSLGVGPAHCAPRRDGIEHLAVDAAGGRHRQQGVVVHREPDALAADAGLLGAAVRHLVGAVGGHVADDDAADLQGTVGAEGGLEIVGEHARLEAVLGVVDGGEGLGLAVHLAAR